MRPEVEKALVAARDSCGVGVAVHQSESVVAELAKKGKKRQTSNRYTYNQRELSTHHTLLSQKYWQKEVGAHRTVYYAEEQKKSNGKKK